MMSASLPPPDFARLNDPDLHPPHTAIKHRALHQLGCQMLHALMVMRNHLAGPAVASVHPVPQELPHGFLTWSLEECRRRLPLSAVWLNVLLKQQDAASFEVRKATIDMDELMTYVKLILRGYLHPQEGVNDVHAQLKQAHDYVHLEQTMRLELEENTKTVRQDFFNIIALQFEHHTRIRRHTHMGQSMTDQNVIAPIQTRLCDAFNAGLVQQNELLTSLAEKAVDKEVEHCLQRIDSDSFCSRCAMTQYYKEIDSMRYRLEEMSALYERDQNYISNQIEYKNVGLEKLRVQRQYYEEEILRFREEVKQHLEKEAQQKLEEEAAAAMSAILEAATIQDRAGQKRKRKTSKGAQIKRN